MDRTIAFGLLVTLVVLMNGCVSQGINESKAVRARAAAVAEAEAAHDIDEVLTFFAEDAIIQPACAPQLQGTEAIRALFAGWFTVLKDFSSTILQVTLSRSSELAYEYGINRIISSGPDGDLVEVGKYLAVWQKLGHEWNIVALSFSTDAPTPSCVDE